MTATLVLLLAPAWGHTNEGDQNPSKLLLPIDSAVGFSTRLSASRVDIPMDMICPICLSRCRIARPLANGTRLNCPTCHKVFTAPGLQTFEARTSWDPELEPTPRAKPAAPPQVNPSAIPPPLPSATKPCPFCSEQIKIEAKKSVDIAVKHLILCLSSGHDRKRWISASAAPIAIGTTPRRWRAGSRRLAG